MSGSCYGTKTENTEKDDKTKFSNKPQNGNGILLEVWPFKYNQSKPRNSLCLKRFKLKLFSSPNAITVPSALSTVKIHPPKNYLLFVAISLILGIFY